MLINAAGEPKGVLHRGERKSLQTDRVILVPGPEDELTVVRWVYEQFTRHGRREAEIAAELNAWGLATDLGRPWTRGTVQQLLTNEKYSFNSNRCSSRYDPVKAWAIWASLALQPLSRYLANFSGDHAHAGSPGPRRLPPLWAKVSLRVLLACASLLGCTRASPC
jgi:hypothetical protein